MLLWTTLTPVYYASLYTHIHHTYPWQCWQSSLGSYRAYDVSNGLSINNIKCFLKVDVIKVGAWIPLLHCSMMFRKQNVWSLVGLPARNPACSSLRFVSTAVFILSYITLHNIFPGTDSITPPVVAIRFSCLWQLHNYSLSPRLRHFLFTPCPSVLLFYLQVLRSLQRISLLLSSYLIFSVVILSIPGDFPTFNFVIVLTTSAFVTDVVFKDNIFLAFLPWKIALLLSGAQFKTSQKCPFHLHSIPVSSLIFLHLYSLWFVLFVTVVLVPCCPPAWP